MSDDRLYRDINGDPTRADLVKPMNQRKLDARIFQIASFGKRIGVKLSWPHDKQGRQAWVPASDADMKEM